MQLRRFNLPRIQPKTKALSRKYFRVTSVSMRNTNKTVSIAVMSSSIKLEQMQNSNRTSKRDYS